MKVAVAIITDQDNRILVTQRPHHAAHGGYWEFPGGKLEINETAEQALVRELYEEVGLEVQDSIYLGEVKHQYPDKSVHLIVFHITKYLGKPSCLEGQINMKWIEKHDLNPKDFPEANHAIFDLLV